MLGGRRKHFIIGGIAAIFIFAAAGCSRRNDADFSAYLNNTLEYFMSETKFDLTLNENGVYRNDKQGITVTVKDNLIQKIEVDKKVKGYEVSDIRVGDKKSRVDRVIQDEYKEKPEIVKDEQSMESVYSYQNGNRKVTVTYNEQNIVGNASVEVTALMVGGSGSSSSGGESTIEKDAIMVTIGNIDVSYSEAMVYLRTAQQIYETEFGNEVWSYDIEGNGTTVGAILKQEVLNQIIQLEVINMVANERGITLNDDEMFQVRDRAADYMKTISVQDQEKYGITEELVVRVFAANQIAEKLYESVTIDVDTDVSEDEAKQCKILRLFVKTYGTDSKGNRTELRQKELDEIEARVKELHKQAKETGDFLSLAKANSDDETIEYTIGHGDLDEQEEKAAFNLKDGEVSNILKNQDGYVILYCESAYDEDATIQVKEQIIEERRSKLFVEKYSEWYGKYEVKVNMNLWNRLELMPLDTVVAEQ